MRSWVLAVVAVVGFGVSPAAQAADDTSGTTCGQLFRDGGFDRALMWRTMETSKKQIRWPDGVKPGKADRETVIDFGPALLGFSEMLVRAGHDCARNPQARFLDVLEKAASAAGAKFEP